MASTTTPAWASKFRRVGSGRRSTKVSCTSTTCAKCATMLPAGIDGRAHSPRSSATRQGPPPAS
eukprot:709057-Pyramimonas_sp.AAC.1